MKYKHLGPKKWLESIPNQVFCGRILMGRDDQVYQPLWRSKDGNPMGTVQFFTITPCLVANEPTWHGCVCENGGIIVPTYDKFQEKYEKIGSFNTKIGGLLVFFHMLRFEAPVATILPLVKTLVESLVYGSGVPAYRVMLYEHATYVVSSKQRVFWMFFLQTNEKKMYHFCLHLVVLGRYLSQLRTG